MTAREGADTAAERARLEALAYGPDTDPRTAARARIDLQDLVRHASGLEARRTPAPPAPVPSAPAPAVARQPDSSGADDPREVSGSRASTAAETENATGEHDAATGLPAGWRRMADRWRAFRHRRLAIAGGVAVVAALAFTGGIAVGTVHPTVHAATSSSAKDAADGTITLTQFLGAPQTFADQLPGDIQAPVRLHSTRLVFTNRSLSADDSQTPWDVYAAIGTDSSLVCVIATPNGLTATETCATRDDALHGHVVLVAQAASEVLTVHVDGGVITGKVQRLP